MSVVSEGERGAAAAFGAGQETPNACRIKTPSAQETKVQAKTVGGRVTTWTGRVVSLDEWRRLTAWERHGPHGRHWNGLSQFWK